MLCLLAAAALPAAAQVSRAAAEGWFAQGVVAFQQEDYRAAAEWLEKAVQEDAAEGTYLHWLGVTYLRLGRAADAAARLEQSLAAERAPAAGRARVRGELGQVRESLARGTPPPALPEPAIDLAFRFPGSARWEGQLGVQTAYDSNPGVLPDEQGGPGIVAAPAAAADMAALLDLRLDHRPLWDRNGWSLGLSLAGHGALHQDLGETDLALARGGASLGWGRDPQGFVEGALGGERLPLGGGPAVLLQAGALYARFGGEELLRTGETGITVMVPETHWTSTRLTARGRRRDYAAGAGDLRQGEEEDEVAAGVDQLLFFGRRDRSLRLGMEAGEVRAGRPLAASFAEARAEAVVAVSSRWMVSLLGARREDRYDHPESNILPFGSGPARDDTTWRAAVTAVWRATDRLGWMVRATHVRRDSNVSVLAFDRTVLSLGFLRSF